MVTFGDKVTKILRDLCLHFARQDGQDRNATKVTIIPKTKRQKYGMNETNIEFSIYLDLLIFPSQDQCVAAAQNAALQIDIVL